ncbi:MAG: hypothetical protein H6738_01990 [Alphaproteobacteria bacterium]|nr:hypothetical protein [Alphaproteobacteria bacterium]MCB9695539.1 hypothetical protein [Alphaproteobacteria bacterium]
MVLLAVLACSGGTATVPSTDAPSTGDTGPHTREERVHAELVASGFTVGTGYAAELDPGPCCGWESCYLFNPDNRYFGWYLPKAPGQTTGNPLPDGRGRNLAWRLRPDEAVIAVGRTPPPSAYFSFRSYIHDRLERTGREWLFFNLGDSLNQFVAGTGPGGPFDADIVVVSVADAATERRVREALLRAGVPEEQINVDVIAADELILGLHEEADTIRLQGRTARFEDPDAGEAWMADPPFTVFRATPVEQATFDPLVPPPLRPRGSGWSEKDDWGAAAGTLELAIRTRYADYRMTPLNTVITDSGDDCPPGCNRDTFFGVSLHFLLPQDKDAFVMVYGVNHERTGKSVYANFSVVEVEHLSASVAVRSDEMVGSARDYVPDHAKADDLYAWKLARDCHGEAHCSEVPWDCPGFPSLGQGAVAWRAYTDAITGTGPSTDELVVDRAALFTRPVEP